MKFLASGTINYIILYYTKLHISLFLGMLRNKAKKRKLIKNRNENSKAKISKMSKQVDDTFLTEENGSITEENSSVKEKNFCRNEEIPSLLDENNQKREENNPIIEENTGKFFSEAIILESVNPQ